MRHEFMENLLLRAAKQEQLVMAARANSEMHKQLRDGRQKKVGLSAFGAAGHATSKQQETSERVRANATRMYQKQQLQQEEMQARKERAKTLREEKKKATEQAKERVAETRRAQGQSRRVELMALQMEKAETEDSALKAKAWQREVIRGGKASTAR